MALAQQKWTEAAGYYEKAMQLAPAFSFAGANRTLALYAGGQTNEAMREMRYKHRLHLAIPSFFTPSKAPSGKLLQAKLKGSQVSVFKQDICAKGQSNAPVHMVD